MNESTEVNEYKPTPKQRRLIETLLDPRNRFLSITAICEKSKITRTAYYKMFKIEGFANYYKSKAKDFLSQAIGPVISAFVKEAKAGSFNHGKVILEISEIYEEKKKLSHVSPDGSMSPNKNFNDFYNDKEQG